MRRAPPALRRSACCGRPFVGSSARCRVPWRRQERGRACAVRPITETTARGRPERESVPLNLRRRRKGVRVEHRVKQGCVGIRHPPRRHRARGIRWMSAGNHSASFSPNSITTRRSVSPRRNTCRADPHHGDALAFQLPKERARSSFRDSAGRRRALSSTRRSAASARAISTSAACRGQAPAGSEDRHIVHRVIARAVFGLRPHLFRTIEAKAAAEHDGPAAEVGTHATLSRRSCRGRA